MNSAPPKLRLIDPAEPPLPGPALAQLAAHARAGAHGEFICVAPEVEFHVFLQGGRLAWATDSAHPLEFSKALRERVSMDAQVFREVIESCRRDRLPLGETLVAWKLATLADVRAALAHQLRTALDGLARADGGACVFLQRHAFAHYDERLTFELDEVLAPLAAGAPAATPPPPAPPAPVVALQPAPPAHGARELLAMVSGARWLDLVDAGATIEGAGDAAHPPVNPRFATAALGDGADFVALRSPGGFLIGARLAASQRQLWAALGAGATVGAATATLFSAGVLARPHRTRRRHDLGRWRRGCERMEAALGDVFAFGRDVQAVALLEGDEVIFATGRGLEEVDCVQLARQRRALLSIEPHAGAAADGGPGAGDRGRTVISGEPRVWCFGEALEGAGADRTLWVFTRREGAQGIGWACLTALARVAGQQPATPPPAAG